MNSFTYANKRIAGALLVIFIGALVVWGWLCKNAVVVQIAPGLAPMKFNTAVAVIAIGLALLFYNQGDATGVDELSRWRRFVILGLSLIPLTIGGLSLVEQITGRSLGVDTLFPHSFPPFSHSSYPGRVSLLSSLCLTLLAISVQCSCSRQRRLPFAVASIFAAVAATTGAVGLIVNVTHIEFTYSFGEFNQMAAHTAVCFVVLGAIEMSVSWRAVKDLHFQYQCKSIAAIVSGLLITMVAWQTLVVQQQSYMRAIVNNVADDTSNQLEVHVKNDARTMRRLADRWKSNDSMTEQEWAVDAADYEKDFPEYQAVEWIDPALHIKWVTPLKGNEKVFALNIKTGSRRSAAVNRALAGRPIAVSEIIDLVQGGHGYLIYAPIVRNGRFLGMIAGVCRVGPLIASLPPTILHNYRVDIVEHGSQISTWGKSFACDPTYATPRTMQVYGVPWSIRVTPTDHAVREANSSLPFVALGGGLLLSFLMGMVISLIGSARLSTQHERDANALLQNTLENSPIGMATVAIDGRWLRVNNALCDIVGYPREELIALDSGTITHPDDLHADQEYIRQLIDAQIAHYTIEKRCFHKLGNQVWILLSVSLIRDKQKKPVYFVSQIQDITLRKQAELQISDYAEVLEFQKKALVKANAALQEIALTDSLTSCFNRRALFEQLEKLFKSAIEQNEPLSIIMLDIDHFKRYNDTHGHIPGDDVLARVASLLKEIVRDDDIVARYGGEEFAVICPGTKLESARKLAERLRLAVAEHAWADEPVTASFGVSTVRTTTRQPQELVAEADAALYLSKERGRNCVSVYQAAIAASGRRKAS